MELIQVLLSEKWLLSAALLVWVTMERVERLADKKVYREQLGEFGRRLDALNDVLLLIKEHIRP